jgi:8-oxo-dGTP pyrophosphatase MutT (NUDIX family)
VTAEQAPDWFTPLAQLPGRVRLEDFALGRLRSDEGRRSAVLMLFGDGPDGPDVLLTQRASTLRSHAGQVSFPGGRLDPGDPGPAAAALREAQEEAGVEPSGVVVAGLFPELYLTPSHHLVTPVLGWWRSPSPVGVGDPAEVARVERVPVGELLDPSNRFTVQHVSGFLSPGFAARGLFVWGFTAILLDRLFALAGWEKPWDEGRLEPLPEVLSPLPDDPAQGETGAGDVPVAGVAGDAGSERSGREPGTGDGG